ncbi:MAG: ribosome-associated translation inhibitor RaiA [Candidatus Peribacter sp.]|nr:ribosome-associated translation inhibitor RaiA [Candidatus Peribacter sp.]
MNIQHFEKNFSFTGRELPTVARKIGKIATYCKRVKDAASAIRVEVERQVTKKERDQIMVMITVELPEKVLRAESRKQDMIEALDRCIEKLEPQLKRYKERWSGKANARKAKEVSA